MNRIKSHTFYKWLRLFLAFELFTIIFILTVYLYLEKNGVIFQNITALYTLLLLPIIYVLYFFRLKTKIDVLESNPSLFSSSNERYFQIFNLKFIFLKNTFIAIIIALIIFPLIVSYKAEKKSKQSEWEKISDFGNKINKKTRDKAN